MRLPILAALIALLPATVAWAGAIEIESDRMTFEHKLDRAEFNDQVHLIRDDFELWCDRMVAFFKENQLEHAEAYGHVRLKQGKVDGSSEEATLDQINGIMTLIGNARLEQEGSSVEGETIVYDTRKEKTVVKPAAGGRTHMFIESNDDTMTLPGPSSKPSDSKAKQEKQP